MECEKRCCSALLKPLKSISAGLINIVACVNLYVSTTRRKKPVSQDTIYFWIRWVVNYAYGSFTNADCNTAKVKDYEVQKIDTALLLKADTWSF